MVIKLTPREFDVLATLDKTFTECCEELNMNKGSYHKHCYNLFKKFGCNTRTAVVIKALKLGIINLEAYDSCPIF